MSLWIYKRLRTQRWNDRMPTMRQKNPKEAPLGALMNCECKPKEKVPTNGRKDKSEVPFSEWVDFCPLHSAAPELLKECQRIVTWFNLIKDDQHRKLVHNQTLESASENWNNLTDFTFDLEPTMRAIAKATEGQR